MITQPKNRPKKHWFKSLSSNGQRAYVRKHPKTRMRATSASLRPASMTGALVSESGFFDSIKKHVEGAKKHVAGVIKHVMDHRATNRRKEAARVSRKRSYHKGRVNHFNNLHAKHSAQAAKHAVGSRWHNYHSKKAQHYQSRMTHHQNVYNPLAVRSMHSRRRAKV